MIADLYKMPLEIQMRKRRFQKIDQFPADDPGLYTPFMIPASMRLALDNVSRACMRPRSAMIRQAIAELLERVYQARPNAEQPTDNTREAA